MSYREDHLAPYAMRESLSQGRRYQEPDHPYRNKFQRDRDRILHAAAFRRLTAKTQVLVSGTNDHHRTRLTHTLEVSQVSRTIARELNLNEDLTEAIALAHDLGHPPFGHAGESALDACMKEHGGFEHNRHGLRIIEVLEQRYPPFPGLNLTWEVRESLAFHSKRPDAPEVKPYREGVLQPTLEAQVVDAADSLVYDVHDLEDAFGVGLIATDDVRSLRCWDQAVQQLHEQYAQIEQSRILPGVLRNLLAWRERELLIEIRRRIAAANIQSVDQVKAMPELLVQEGAQHRPLIQELHQFLQEHVYHHPRVLEMSQRGRQIISELFRAYSAQPGLMPLPHAQRSKTVDPALAACDYLAGMTDRLALAEYGKLFQS